MIGRTLDQRAAHANPKSGQYYGPHNIEEYNAKGIHVYMRDPQSLCLVRAHSMPGCVLVTPGIREDNFCGKLYSPTDYAAMTPTP